MSIARSRDLLLYRGECSCKDSSQLLNEMRSIGGGLQLCDGCLDNIIVNAFKVDPGHYVCVRHLNAGGWSRRRGRGSLEDGFVGARYGSMRPLETFARM